jgi:hypothetical protein
VKAFEAELNAQINNKTLTQNEAIALLSDWRQQGVDLVKLGAVLIAFVAGADVNTAAKAGENAAENNGASIAIPIAGAAAGAAGSTVIIVGGIPILLGGLAQLANEDTTLEDAVYAEEGGDREGIEDYNADQQNASNNSGSSNNNNGGDNGDGDQKPPAPASANKLKKQVERGQAPKSVERVDIGNIKYGEQSHIHFKNGSALNRNGSWKHGYKSLTNAEKKWIIKNGWTLPK